MDINKVIAKFDHNSSTLDSAIGVDYIEILADTVKKWFDDSKSHSVVIEMILKHESLNDNEKIACLVIIGEILAYEKLFDLIGED